MKPYWNTRDVFDNFFTMKHVMKLNKNVHLPFEHQMIKTFQCNFRWLNQSTCGKTKEAILLCALHGLLEDIEKALSTCICMVCNHPIHEVVSELQNTKTTTPNGLGHQHLP